jgi:hypothetical protein
MKYILYNSYVANLNPLTANSKIDSESGWEYKKTNGTTILERGLPIYGLRPNHVCEVSFQLRI